jgi:hypothetical protein
MLQKLVPAFLAAAVGASQITGEITAWNALCRSTDFAP